MNTRKSKLKTQSEQLGQEIASIELEQFSLHQFTAIIRKYVGIGELTPTIVNDFIDRIIVHVPDKSTGKRVQYIQIAFSLIGEIELPDTATPQELNATTKTPRRRRLTL